MTSKCQHGEEATEERFINGVNWAPDSDDDMEDSEARDAACTLLHLASREVWRFVDDKAHHEMVELMLPILHPLVYGDHEDDVNDAGLHYCGLDVDMCVIRICMMQRLPSGHLYFCIITICMMQ
jgi:hypothetical protein